MHICQILLAQSINSRSWCMLSLFLDWSLTIRGARSAIASPLCCSLGIVVALSGREYREKQLSWWIRASMNYSILPKSNTHFFESDISTHFVHQQQQLQYHRLPYAIQGGHALCQILVGHFQKEWKISATWSQPGLWTNVVNKNARRTEQGEV